MVKPADLDIRCEQVDDSSTYTVNVTYKGSPPVQFDAMYRSLVMAIVEITMHTEIDRKYLISCLVKDLEKMFENAEKGDLH